MEQFQEELLVDDFFQGLDDPIYWDLSSSMNWESPLMAGKEQRRSFHAKSSLPIDVLVFLAMIFRARIRNVQCNVSFSGMV